MSQRNDPAFQELMEGAKRVLPFASSYNRLGAARPATTRGQAVLDRAKRKGVYGLPWRATLRKRPAK